MNKATDSAIILARTDFGEKDRILTVIGKHSGKVRVIAKSVRSAKSKLAGGIELFSESSIGYVQGRGDICTLTSSRLIRHFGNIVSDLDRTNYGYEILRAINKNSHDGSGQEYYGLLLRALFGLNNKKVSLEIIRLWFALHFLNIQGTSINLSADENNNKLEASLSYNFDFDKRCFIQAKSGKFLGNHLKFLRLLSSMEQPAAIKVEPKIVEDCLSMMKNVMQNDEDKV